MWENNKNPAWNVHNIAIVQRNYEAIWKRRETREEAEDAFSEITNVWSPRPISIVRVIARPITIGRRYCWLGVASRDFGTPVASAASEAHDIKLHAHEDKVREEVHACRRSVSARESAHADVFGSDDGALSSPRCGMRDEMKNENGYEIGNGRGIYLAMWRKTQPNGRHVQSSLRAFSLPLSYSPTTSFSSSSSPSVTPTELILFSSGQIGETNLRISIDFLSKESFLSFNYLIISTVLSFSYISIVQIISL